MGGLDALAFWYRGQTQLTARAAGNEGILATIDGCP